MRLSLSDVGTRTFQPGAPDVCRDRAQLPDQARARPRPPDANDLHLPTLSATAQS